MRLVQIDAPEAQIRLLRPRCDAGADRSAPKGTRVTLERDPALDDVDAYGRLLRYVFVGRSATSTCALVAEGAAAPYFFRNERGRYAGDLLTTRPARRAPQERGLWGACPRRRLEPGLGSVTGPASSPARLGSRR